MDKEAEKNAKLIHDLENVDQRELARQNAFLRWLVLFFIVALVLTVIFLPHVNKAPEAPQEEAQHLNNYSEQVTQQWTRTDIYPVATQANIKVVKYIF
ncbi:hypothetical protein [Streptomyces sp. CHB9.2]|uniref:hypothetical protein n=1 Tax=Streptomyces sp. CHB9.2 TaxID=2841670 RepID=UPI002094743A|nr:hypothetical protein [Streptomyces sp. CHB9.2]MCO6704687.1 hypothetical protein [Streptomyces sp. CHB9.2]